MLYYHCFPPFNILGGLDIIYFVEIENLLLKVL